MWVSLFSESKYNWKKILKDKSNDELVDFLDTPYIDLEGMFAALEELKSRKYDQKKLDRLYQNLINHWKGIRKGKSEKTIIEHIEKYSLFIQLTVLPFFLFFLFTITQGLEIAEQMIVLTIAVGLVVSNIFNQQKKLKEKQIKKHDEIKEIDARINNIIMHMSKNGVDK